MRRGWRKPSPELTPKQIVMVDSQVARRLQAARDGGRILSQPYDSIPGVLIEWDNGVVVYGPFQLMRRIWVIYSGQSYRVYLPRRAHRRFMGEEIYSLRIELL